MKLLTVTSRQNPLIKSICGLVEKKNRHQSSLFRFDGIKLLIEAAGAGMPVKYVICREDAEERVSDIALSAGTDTLVTVPHAVFDKLSEEKSPEGVITVCEMPDGLHRRERADAAADIIGRNERILIAESLRDPGNLGTVMRSCYALGIDRLVLSADCADIYNPKTVRAAMGAIFRLSTLTVTDELPSLIGKLRERGRRVLATALHSEALKLGTFEIMGGDCFVIGNEGHGLREQTVSACTSPVVIPMREGAESLNAAAAAAICIWETVHASSNAKEDV